MIRYFLRAARAQLGTGLTLFLLSLLGVALGVASVVSIQIINLNALAAFRGSMEAVSGDADLTVVGTLPVLAETVYPEVLGTEGVAGRLAAVPTRRRPRRRDRRRILLSRGHRLRLLHARRSALGRAEPVDLADALGEPGWVAVTTALADEKGLALGDRFEVSIGSRRVELVVGALFDFQKTTPLASPRLVVMDIAQAQSLLGTPGEIHEIDVKVADGTSTEAVAERLRAKLGPKAQVLTPEQREQQASDLLSAFRLNLTALSLISLFVGGFLVYSSTQASLVRRRTEFGLLRSLGATHRRSSGLLAGDVVVLGLAGVALGMPLGYLAARANVDRVSVTVSNLYLLEEIHSLEVPLVVLRAGDGRGARGRGARRARCRRSSSAARTPAPFSPLSRSTSGWASGRRGSSLLGVVFVAAAGVLYLRHRRPLAPVRLRPGVFPASFAPAPHPSGSCSAAPIS